MYLVYLVTKFHDRSFIILTNYGAHHEAMITSQRIKFECWINARGYIGALTEYKFIGLPGTFLRSMQGVVAG